MHTSAYPPARPVPHRRLLAVAFGPATMAAALAELPGLASQADLVELRLDLFQEPFDLPALIAARGGCPIVATVRPEDQGGRSKAPPAERLRTLLQAAGLGAEYVDVEWDAATPAALAALKAAGAAVVVSRHDFAAMPPDLDTAWWDAMAERGADVVKVVGTAADPRDCLPVLRAFRRATLPTAAIAMGTAGLASRVLALREPACFLTFAAPNTGSGTAPGQLSLADMRTLYRAPRLGPATAVYGLLGPEPDTANAGRYNAWFDALGQDAVALPIVAEEEASDVVAAYREVPVAGWHVHGPSLQATVPAALDDLGPSARRQGKVNAIVADVDGALVGHWVESPAEQLALWTGRSAPEPDAAR